MARVKQGDYVKVVDSDIAGYCVEIIDDGTLIIETADGLIIPVKNTRIVVSEFNQDLSEASVSSAGRKERAHGRYKNPSRHSSASSQIVEIDLHTTIKPHIKTGPLPSDILIIQLDRFSSALKKAVSENKKELIAIHGEGSGRLRSEIRRISRELFPKLEVMDAPFHKYGHGATRIILKQ